MSARLAPYAAVVVAAVGLGVLLAYGLPQQLVLPALVFLAAVEVGVVIAVVVRRYGDPLSLLPLIGIFYFLAFAAGAVYFHIVGPEQGFSFSDGTLNVALAMAMLAYACLSVGYLANPLGPVLSRLPRLPALPSDISPLYVAVPLLAVGWPARVLQAAGGNYFHDPPVTENVEATGSTFVVQTAASLPTLAVAIIGAGAYFGRFGSRSRAFRRAFWVLTMLEAIWYFPTGERGLVVGVAVMAVVVVFYSRSRGVPWKMLLAGGVVTVFGLFPFIEAYRGDYRQLHVYQDDPVQSLRIAFETVADRSPVETVEESLRSVFSRFNDIGSLATIVTKGPDRMGLADGETLRWTVEAALPRAVHPDKEDPGQFGNEFGRSYDIIPSDNRSTSLATTQAGELYIGFGWAGVVLGMLALGALYRAINDLFGARRSEPNALAIYSVTLFPLIYGLETIVVLGVVGVLKTLAIYAVLIWLLVWMAPRLSSVGRRLVRRRAATA